MRIRPVKVKPLEDYKLLIDFNTGEQKIFDVKPYFKHAFYAKLQEGNSFNQVFTDDVTIQWANGCDIAPHELYDNGILVRRNVYEKS